MCYCLAAESTQSRCGPELPIPALSRNIGSGVSGRDIRRFSVWILWRNSMSSLYRCLCSIFFCQAFLLCQWTLYCAPLAKSTGHICGILFKSMDNGKTKFVDFLTVSSLVAIFRVIYYISGKFFFTILTYSIVFKEAKCHKKYKPTYLSEKSKRGFK
jgi:hypothetical protein